MGVTQSTQRTPFEIAGTVWMVANKTGCTLFDTEDGAQRYVSSFPASIGGGLHVSSMPVFGNPAPAAPQGEGA